MRFIYSLYVSAALLLTVCTLSCAKKTETPAIAPGAPGSPPTWAFSGKTGIGTSYEAYINGKHSDKAITGAVSKVWFSLAQGVLTETMFGLIHEAQLKDLKLIVVGDGFIDVEETATDSEIEYLSVDGLGRPRSLAYKITNTDKDGKYVIEKYIFTHPDTHALMHRVVFRPKESGLRVFVSANPHVANTGGGDVAWVDNGLHATDGDIALTLLFSDTVKHYSVGFVGGSDVLSELNREGSVSAYVSTGDQPGNVELSAELNVNDRSETIIDIALGFGVSVQESKTAAAKVLSDGYDVTLAKYNGAGEYVGWSDFLDSLSGLSAISASAQDGGKLLNVSAMVLKAQEDKTHSGALIASLSNPWGDVVSADSAATGYKAVWPRDFYQCAMAFLALGDSETPLVAFEYLKKVQVSELTPGNNGVGGWFLQKTHVDGELEWVGVQMDQTAMPIMLGWKLWKQGVLSDQRMNYWYHAMLKPAADFLSEGGQTDLLWANLNIVPPFTQQERWEEQGGYSPSTTAAIVAGLVTAADLAKASGDTESSARYLAVADSIEAKIEALMFTTTGVFNGDQGNGQYYLRINLNDDPNDNGDLEDRNGRGVIKEKDILDGGFLELVRYGVRAADHPNILDTLDELDNQNIPHEFRVKYLFSDGENTFPGWRRYGDDGYGEDKDLGSGYAESGKNSPGQRGRVWPFFTGERGHYELAARLTGADVASTDTTDLLGTYVAGMEYFANEGMMLPEQVWDGVGVDAKSKAFELGEGTNSATPLAWTHAEYIKLVRSMHDKQVWDYYPVVGDRYAK